MLKEVGSQNPDVRCALLDSRMAILMHPQPALSAWLAFTQRQGTVATALAVLLVASHQLLVAPR